MADDPNKSSQGPINALDDYGFSDIERIGRRASRHTAEDISQRARFAEARQRVSQYETALSSGPSKEITQLLGKELAHERKMMNSLEPRIEMRAETQRQRAIDLTQSAISRAFDPSSVNGQSSTFARSSVGQRLATSMMGMSYEQLEERRGRTMNKIGALAQRAETLSEEIYSETGAQDPQKMAQLQQIYRQRGRLVNFIGGVEAAQRQQRSLGLDPESRMETLFRAGQKAEANIFRQDLSKELATGGGDLGGKSLAQLKEREANLSQQLVQELEKLKDTTGKTTSEIDNMRKAAETTAEDLKKTGEAISQVGSGGGGRSGTIDKLNFLSGAFGTAGNLIQQIGVNQRIGQVQNITGYAAIENDKYRTYKAAAAGDVASQLMLSQFAGAESFGKEIKTTTNIALGAYAAGGIAQTTAGGLRTLEALGEKGNPASYITGTATQNSTAVLQGMQDTAQGIAGTATSVADLYRGVSGNAAAQQAIRAQLEARRQIMAVGAEQLQGFRDFGVGMGTAAMSMGSRGGAFLDQAVNKSTMEQMVSSRISPEQMAQMAQMGAQQIGSTFNQSQIFAARGLERSGFGSMQENMQRIATLSSVGLNNPKDGLGSVLEVAFSKSLDNSKAISMMVENTAVMAKSSFAAAAGLDITGAAATVLGANIGNKPINEGYAVERAMTAQEYAKNITTNTDISFSGMANTARISKRTGLGGDDAIFAARLTTEELKSLQGKDPSAIREYMYQKGVNPNNSNLKPKELINELLNVSRETLFEGRGAGIAFDTSGKIRESLTSKSKINIPYEQLSTEEKVLLGKMGGGTITAKEFYGTSLGIGASEPNIFAKGKAVLGMAGEGGSEQQKMLDDMRTQGFKQLSQAALEATSNFKTAADALRALGSLAKEVENIGDTGGEGKFKTAAADAAGSFGKSTMQFKDSVTDFSKAVNALMNKSGLDSDPQKSGMDMIQKNERHGSKL